MQFKHQGNRIQVLAYRGYDKEKRRAVVKMLGSLDDYNFQPSDGLIEGMTDDEINDGEDYFSKMRLNLSKLKLAVE